MKIYNRKKFVSGAFCILLGALLLVTSALRHGNASSWALALVLIALGAGELARSLSKTWTKEDKLEEWDERNRFIDWNAKSRAFQLTQGISFVLMLAMLAMKGLSTSGWDWPLPGPSPCSRSCLPICTMSSNTKQEESRHEAAVKLYAPEG